MTYPEMLLALKTKTHTEVNRYGQTILVKEIPDADTAGEFDPRVLAVRLKEEAAQTPFGYGDTLASIRANMGWPNHDITTEPITTENASVPGADGHSIPIEIYRPQGSKIRPCFVFIHGGGFLGGTVKCVANDCRFLAQKADAVVVSVDYRLAPEYPYPYGFRDCCDVVEHLYAHPEEYGICNTQIGIGGDSAGGNLAAAIALRDRDEGTHKIAFEALMYPVVNLPQAPSPAYAWREEDYAISGEHAALVRKSVHALGSDSAAQMVGFYTYGSIEKAKAPYVSPIFAADLSGMPPTLIVNAEFDYLRLEGEAYGRCLAKAGNRVEMIRYQGTDHAFLDKTGDYPQCEDALCEIARAFLQAL
jgi:acetyl esterase